MDPDKSKNTKSQDAVPPKVELVPVKTKYPDPPPAAEPDWVHWDWIQTTAATLAADWLKTLDWKRQWGEAYRRGNTGDNDPEITYQRKWYSRLWNEIVPLMSHIQAHFPLEVWSKFQHCRSGHDAERNPETAVTEWQFIRDYALDRLAKEHAKQQRAEQQNAEQSQIGDSVNGELAARLNAFTDASAADKAVESWFEQIPKFDATEALKQFVEFVSHEQSVIRGLVFWNENEERNLKNILADITGRALLIAQRVSMPPMPAAPGNLKDPGAWEEYLSSLKAWAIGEARTDNTPGDASQPGSPAGDTNKIKAKGRKGRLPKGESERGKATMLAELKTHPTLKDDPAELARIVGASESSIRRWLAELSEQFEKLIKSQPKEDADGNQE